MANDVWQGMSFEKWGDLSVGIASSVKNKRRLGRRDRASFGLWDTPQEWQVPGIGYLAHEQAGCVAKTHRNAERCVIASSTHPTNYRLQALRKNAEFGTGNGEEEMADDKRRMADDKCEVSQGRIVGHDSNRVIDDSKNDKNGILSHEETDAADRPCQGACVRQSLPGGVKTSQKTPNEAQLKSTQRSLPLKVKLSAPEPAGRERSRSAAAGTDPHDAGNVPFDPIAPARERRGEDGG